jgi:hypothetical protein
MDSVHIVKFKYMDPPAVAGIQFLCRRELDPPEFPSLSAAVSYSEAEATKTKQQLQLIVCEKKTGKRKVTYEADGTGVFKKHPLV